MQPRTPDATGELPHAELFADPLLPRPDRIWGPLRGALGRLAAALALQAAEEERLDGPTAQALAEAGRGLVATGPGLAPDLLRVTDGAELLPALDQEICRRAQVSPPVALLGERPHHHLSVALQIAAAGEVARDLLPALTLLEQTLSDWPPEPPSGHLNNLTYPCREARRRASRARDALLALDTGLGPPEEGRCSGLIARLVAETGLPFFAAGGPQSSPPSEPIAESSGALRGVALTLGQTSRELHGAGGGSTLAEVRQSCLQVLAHDAAISLAAQAGDPCGGLLSRALLESVGLLAEATRVLRAVLGSLPRPPLGLPPG